MSLTKDFNWRNFKNIWQRRKGNLKALLLNQQIIAGIGNIYADEICWRAKVMPTRKVDTLTDSELKKIFQACQYIIKKAIDKQGTTFSDYRKADGHKGNFVRHLKVYGREGQKCLGCKKTIIQKIVLGGRGTRYCPYCTYRYLSYEYSRGFTLVLNINLKMIAIIQYL